HHDTLWLSHFPGSAPIDPGNPIYKNQKIGLHFLFEPTVAITPAAALIAALRIGRLERLEWALLAYVILAAVTMNVLPIYGLGKSGAVPRFLLHFFPGLARLVGRALAPGWEGDRRGGGVMLGTALLASWVATPQWDGHATRILVVTYVLLLAA